MIAVLIVPTGIEAQIGGHAGDANPVAKLIGACCDKLITHPNVVNASDINEMPENTLYVEGSMLDRFLEGRISLKEVRQNRIFVAVNKPVRDDTINAVSAARATIGIDAKIIELESPLKMVAKIEGGKATGEVYGVSALLKQLSGYSFDALAIHSPIEVDRGTALNYFRNGGVNPWGGVEAIASKLIAEGLNKPVAHAPVENVTPDDEELYYIFNEVVDPRMSAEAISNCYLHCVLKGLNKAPRISEGFFSINVSDVDVMVSPFVCYGRPHRACYKKGIPVIYVKENKTIINSKDKKAKALLKDHAILVDDYWQAAGIIMAMKAGICPSSVRRPLNKTIVI